MEDWQKSRWSFIFYILWDTVEIFIRVQKEIELTDYAGIKHFGEEQWLDVVQHWRVKPLMCLCVIWWTFEPVSIWVSRVSVGQEVTWECSSSKFTPNLSSANHGRRWEDPVSKAAVSKVIPSCRHPQDGEGANFRGNTRTTLFSILFGFYCTHSVKDRDCNQTLINAAAIFSSFTHGLNYECDVICLFHVGPRDVHY